MSMTITDLAIDEIKKIKTEQALDSSTFLRIVIVGGGCSGMRYSLGFDNVYDPLIDTKYTFDGIELVTDKKFDLFFDGTTIDFINTLTSTGFNIDNPNFPAGVGGCAGCGGH